MTAGQLRATPPRYREEQSVVELGVATPRNSVVDGSLFLTGLAGTGALLTAAATAHGEWSRILPLAVVAHFWSACVPSTELAQRRQWPLLFRYPAETAALMATLAVGYLIGHGGRTDPHFFGMLAGALGAIASGLRGYHIRAQRGQDLDRTFGALSRYVQDRRWRSANSSRFSR